MIEGVPEGINSTIGQNGTSDSPVLEPSDESNLEPPVAANGMLIHYKNEKFSTCSSTCHVVLSNLVFETNMIGF